MAIIIELDVQLAKRKMKSTELAAAIGITPQNLSILRAGRARAIRFSTLEAICRHLQCQPGDILIYNDDPTFEDEQDEIALKQNRAT
ncbi:helix-turn-helix transcriptional regulator [Shewanella profunda]|uniref:helix-turn-helix domain-containing protein n=1 Tax=Shewanella profunda TaxID=254793 RepID=UPI00200D5FB7|nr:helix-turn-helix transcriptional regulator [Shewanella profunda]MCL1088397.1 helix-turn-helix transcriptional regulator [Shewanella profunda]